MSYEEIIILFKKAYNIEGEEWTRFCRRYSSRNVDTIYDMIKDVCSAYNATLTNRFKKYLKAEIKAQNSL